MKMIWMFCGICDNGGSPLVKGADWLHSSYFTVSINKRMKSKWNQSKYWPNFVICVVKKNNK